MNANGQLGRQRGGSGGFSLTEILVVIAVVSLLLALSAPSLVSLGPSRKAGIHELAGFLEAARAAAVATRSDRIVAFADAGFPGEKMALRAYALFAFEEAADGGTGDQGDAGTAGAARPMRRLTPWRTLPKGLVFARGADFETAEGGAFRTLLDLEAIYEVPVPALGTDGPDVATRSLPCVVFGSDGGVRHPGFADADALHAGVVEGFLEAGSARFVPTASRPGGGGRTYSAGDCLGIGLYTGRARILTD